MLYYKKMSTQTNESKQETNKLANTLQNKCIHEDTVCVHERQMVLRGNRLSRRNFAMQTV